MTAYTLDLSGLFIIQKTVERDLFVRAAIFRQDKPCDARYLISTISTSIVRATIASKGEVMPFYLTPLPTFLNSISRMFF
jgi:hypothetical protein